MTYSLNIARDGDVLFERELSSDEVIDLLTSAPAPSEPLPKPKRRAPRTTKKESAGNDKWKELEDKAPSHLLTPEKKKQIENLLIERISVAEISEQMKVSKPTIYVIKARLMKEGRL